MSPEPLGVPVLWAARLSEDKRCRQMHPVPKSCEEIRNFLMDYLDRELPVVDSLLFRMHVMLCTACRGYMNRYKDSTELARKFLDDPPPIELINLATEFMSKRTLGSTEKPST